MNQDELLRPSRPTAASDRRIVPGPVREQAGYVEFVASRRSSLNKGRTAAVKHRKRGSVSVGYRGPSPADPIDAPRSQVQQRDVISCGLRFSEQDAVSILQKIRVVDASDRLEKTLKVSP